MTTLTIVYTQAKLDLLRCIVCGNTGTPLLVDALARLDVCGLGVCAKVTGGQQVELVFLLIHGAVGEEEGDTGDEGDDGYTAVVPGDVGVGGEGSKGLGEGSREGRGEELDGLDKRPHVLWCLGEGVLESCHGCEDLGNGNENVDTGDGPDGDVGLVLGVMGLVVARGLVDVVLEYGSPDHGEGTEDETSGNLLDGGEADSSLAEEGIDNAVHD